MAPKVNESALDEPAMILVQVCYARPEVQILTSLIVPAGSVVADAIEASGVLAQRREIDLHCWRVGIFGKLKSLDTPLRDQDRVEIYRPLIADPKEARRKRVNKKALSTK